MPTLSSVHTGALGKGSTVKANEERHILYCIRVCASDSHCVNFDLTANTASIFNQDYEQNNASYSPDQKQCYQIASQI